MYSCTPPLLSAHLLPLHLLLLSLDRQNIEQHKERITGFQWFIAEYSIVSRLTDCPLGGGVWGGEGE